MEETAKALAHTILGKVVVVSSAPSGMASAAATTKAVKREREEEPEQEVIEVDENLGALISPGSNTALLGGVLQHVPGVGDGHSFRLMPFPGTLASCDLIQVSSSSSSSSSPPLLVPWRDFSEYVTCVRRELSAKWAP